MNKYDDTREWCLTLDHHWRETYYGYECEICHEFIPFGCEPWIDYEDENEPLVIEYYDDWIQQNEPNAEQAGEK